MKELTICGGILPKEAYLFGKIGETLATVPSSVIQLLLSKQSCTH